jgi:hypothetical protein
MHKTVICIPWSPNLMLYQFQQQETPPTADASNLDGVNQSECEKVIGNISHGGTYRPHTMFYGLLQKASHKPNRNIQTITSFDGFK